MLFAERDGSGDRLVLVHGFTQNRSCWGDVARELAADHEVVRVDAPGHGRSSDVRADLVEGADLLGRTGGRATYLGYSMGGRLCLHLALAHPGLVRGLVLVGATAGIEDPAEREARRGQDDERAEQLEREGLDAFLAGWLGQPLFAGLPPEARHVEARLENTVAGLASSLRLAGTGSQEPLWTRLGTVRAPVLVVAGSEDPKFTALGERLVSTIGPNASLALVPGAGHAAHLEAPAAFLAVVRPWLQAHRL